MSDFDRNWRDAQKARARKISTREPWSALDWALLVIAGVAIGIFVFVWLLGG